MYGLTLDEIPIDLKLNASQYDCQYILNEDDGFIIIDVDLPANDSD